MFAQVSTTNNLIGYEIDLQRLKYSSIRRIINVSFLHAHSLFDKRCSNAEQGSFGVLLDLSVGVLFVVETLDFP